MKPTPKKTKYSNGRRLTTLVLSDELVRLGKEYFPHTKYGSLSAFFDRVLLSEVRKRASRIRGVGIKIPETVFAK